MAGKKKLKERLKWGEIIDPVTGDKLTLGERVSWFIQGIMRNWLFLGLISVLTAIVWIFLDPIWRHPITDQWNLWASFVAIMIEGVTAMALINQTKRDAAVTREIRRISKHLESLSETTLKRIETLEAQLEEKA